MPPSKPPRIATAGAGGEDDGDPLRARKKEDEKQVEQKTPVDEVVISTDRELLAQLFPLHAGYPVTPTMDALQMRMAALRRLEVSEELLPAEKQRVTQELALCLAQIDVLQRAQVALDILSQNSAPPQAGTVQPTSGGAGGNMPEGNLPQEHHHSADDEPEERDEESLS